MSGKESSRVLVIDDDDQVLVIVRKMLEAEMFSVDVSVSAREALDRLPETRYDAILCDMWMPGMTGKDFYEQLKKEFSEYQSRIIFLTGDIASEATWDFIEQKGLPYVLKPVSQPELRRKLREVIGERPKAEPEKGRENRRHRRLAMKANLRVRRKRWGASDPEITRVGNASKGGVYFLTDRRYSVGTDVLVSFPYGGPGDLEQEGSVVRVDERADGRRGVAIALGEAAVAARARDVSMTAEPPLRPSVIEQTAEVSDLKLQLDRERKEAHRLTDELADLKGSYKRAARERDRLASEPSDRDLQLRELTSARDEMSRLTEELKQQVGDLQEKLAAAERELAQQAELAGRAQQETARAADLKTELDQEQEAARRLTQELADLKAMHEGVTQERDRLATQVSDRNLRLHELTATQDTVNRLMQESRKKMQVLQMHVTGVEAERDQAQKEVGAARDEAEKWRAESLRQQQEAAPTRRATRRQTSSEKKEKGEVARLGQELKGSRARIQKFQGEVVGPLTNLAATCDLLAMDKSLDEDTRKTAKEISQQAALVRKAFRELARKS